MSFRRKFGAAADIKELEYIIALHQTSAKMRDNATVSSRDIASLLMSRYRLKITHRQAIDLVDALGGDTAVVQGSKRPVKKRHYLPFFGKKESHPIEKKEPSVEMNGSESSGGHDHEETNESASGYLNFSLPFFGKKEAASIDEKPSSVHTNGSDPSGGIDNKSIGGTEKPSSVHTNGSQPSGGIDNKSIGGKEETSEEGSGDGDKKDDVVPEANGGDKEQVRDRDLVENYLDLVQIMSILFIPAIAQSAQHFWHPVPPPTAPVEPTGSKFKLFFVRRKNRFQSWCLATFGIKHPREATIPRAVRSILSRDFPEGAIVDEAFVEALLLRYGEVERAQNPQLIREMVQAAHSASGTFDDEAFFNAFASDLQDWDTEGLDRLSTFFYDVFQTENPATIEKLGVDEPKEVDVDEEEANDESASTSKRRKCCCLSLSRCTCCWGTAKPFQTETFNIDLVTDSHASLLTVVAIWAFFIFSVAICGTLIVATPLVETACDISDFGCQLADTVYSWTMIAILLSLFGVIMVMPLSYGNNPYRWTYFRAFVGIMIALIYTGVPYLVIEEYERKVADDNRSLKTTPSDIVTGDFWDTLQSLALSTGLIVAAMFLIEMFTSLCRHCLSSATRMKRPARWLERILSTSSVRGETRLKSAAAWKVETMFENAYTLHQLDKVTQLTASPRSTQKNFNRSASSTSNEQTMRNFVLYGERNASSGGFIWTWWRILNGSLFTEEGIWINTRLITIQAAQILVGIVISIILLDSVKRIADAAQNERDNLDPDLPQWVFDLVPTREMVYRALYPASFTAIAVMVLLFLIYLPSAVTTILRYRCQDKPSLGSPYFNKYRASVDAAYMNTANALYGMVGSAGLFYLLIGLILFLFQWPFSQSFMIRLTAWGLGLSITCGLKFLLTLTCRTVQYRSFHRIRPSAASFSALALECWYIGLGGSVLIGRITQFLFAAAFWIGRIDVQFLSEDVHMFGYAFDYVPTNFVKDLLLHEAHRHPYIERLMQIYLMKLRHGKSFSTDAGAAWRQLATMALCPWVVKYRVFNEERYASALSELEERRQEEATAGPGEALEDAMTGLAKGGVTGLAKGGEALVGGLAMGFAVGDPTAARQDANRTSHSYSSGMDADHPLESMLSEESLQYISADEEEVD